MIQSNKSINNHVEEYLDYYCKLSSDPEFAVLLKGRWGAGKTWFVKRYCEKLKANNQGYLYVSLYGMTSFSEIEEAFFQQLHPILSSKGMAITGKILKGFLKGTVKIDLDNDKKDDGTLSVQIPDFDLPGYLTDADKRILIFDDLERCKIEISNILGYINYFVEHKGLKVVIVANEDELLKDDKYKFIKEKLIGKTFTISLDFEGALEQFITLVDDSNIEIRNFLIHNTELIRDLYTKAEYKNLRILRQIVLDFERIFKSLPDKVKNKPELLQHILKLLTVFSIEIKRGNMSPENIRELEKEYISGLSNRIDSRQSANSITNITENPNEQTLLQKVLSRYPRLSLYEPFPNEIWWETFFDKGSLDEQELEQSLLTNKHFQDENTPNWIKLWHFHDLNDNEFDDLLKKVESEYNNRCFFRTAEIIHIFGIFLELSDAGLYHKSKREILNEAKLYIDYLKNEKFDIDSGSQVGVGIPSGKYCITLGLLGQQFAEFQEFYSYVEEVRELAETERMPSMGQNLLTIMQADTSKFYRLICRNNLPNLDVKNQEYSEIAVLRYIQEKEFVEKLLSLDSKQRKKVFFALNDRYRNDSINVILIEELEWLKCVYNLLLDKANQLKGKVSGYNLESDTKRFLDEAIAKLEAKKNTARN